MLRPVAGEQTALQRHESDGEVGPDRRAQTGAAIGMQPGGNVESDHGAPVGAVRAATVPVPIDGADDLRRRAGDLAVQAGAE